MLLYSFVHVTGGFAVLGDMDDGEEDAEEEEDQPEKQDKVKEPEPEQGIKTWDEFSSQIKTVWNLFDWHR